MKFLAAFVLVLLMPLTAIAASDEDKASNDAKSWLVLIDAGNYAQSWQRAAPFFQAGVTADKWAVSVKNARDQMGPLVSRNLTSVTFTKVLMGVPDGSYALVVFTTKFANKAAAMETMAMTMDKGMWKPIGYHLR